MNDVARLDISTEVAEVIDRWGEITHGLFAVSGGEATTPHDGTAARIVQALGDI
ncbi:hypothetical protein AB0G19_20465 [Streptomyces althioticus]|jgi:hypothetical protein|uniref:hypothetical protein n=1 Tax=Streptomyces althioticus group TaxID=2867194 RepID=UPI0017842341|nr:hypothetical protein OG968_08745 [Streptomyces althioticus]WTB95255.1 hypothetical protein OHA53_27050 [Streptomyces althioticus]GGQ78388.1 hypothetical protein GCM10010267_46730 [Streptomyces griseorubens]